MFRGEFRAGPELQHQELIFEDQSALGVVAGADLPDEPVEEQRPARLGARREEEDSTLADETPGGNSLNTTCQAPRAISSIS